MSMRILTTLLSYDHGILRQALDVLADIEERGTWEQHRHVLPEMEDFLQRFMDQYHHGKEERFLFPAAAAGSDRLKTFIPDLVDDHRKAKAFADAFGRDLAAWDKKGLQSNAHDLVAHMRGHIAEEEDFVFPEFETALDAERDMEMFEASQRFLEENFGASFQQDMEDFANRLQDQVMGKGVIDYHIGV